MTVPVVALGQRLRLWSQARMDEVDAARLRALDLV
jgi:hypothetical protein